MIGSAIVRESRFAWSREKRRAAGGGEGDAVARDAGREGRRLGESERQAVGGPRLAAAALLGTAVGGEHRRGPGQQAVGGRPRPAQTALDLALEAVADDGGGQEGEEQDDRRRAGRTRAALRRSGGAGRSAAPPRRRRGGRPRSSCAAPGRPRPSPSRRARGRGRCGRSWRPAAARPAPGRGPARAPAAPGSDPPAPRSSSGGAGSAGVVAAWPAAAAPLTMA